MDIVISTLDLLKRQQQGESGADKLLDLLSDPYRSQVSWSLPNPLSTRF